MHDHRVHRDNLIDLAPIHLDKRKYLPQGHYDYSPRNTPHKMDTLHRAYLEYLGTVVLSPVVLALYILVKIAYIGTIHKNFLFHLGANIP